MSSNRYTHESSSKNMPAIGSRALRIVALILRVIAVAYVLLIVLSFSGWVSLKLSLMPFIQTATGFLPDVLAGRWVIPTPLDGVFHTDYAIFAGILFLLDALCIKVARSL